MAKFKVGDRVKAKKTATFPNNKPKITEGYVGFIPGHLFTLDEFKERRGKSYGSQHVDDYELVTNYTLITPKVGERYRVVKELKGVASIGGYFPVGSLLKVISVNDDWGKSGNTHKCLPDKESIGWQILEKCFTTEYLELVEEEKPNFFQGFLDAYQPLDCVVSGGTAEPIKQSLITQSMNFIKKLTQSAADKTLEKAHFTNECGELTSRGHDALTSLVFQEKKDALVKLAQEVIDEETK